MRVIFMGTPDFAVPVLEVLSQHHDVVCVYTQPPRPAGKGYKLKPSPVHVMAEKLGIEVRTPVSLRRPEEQELFRSLHADVAIVCAYGLILPREILELPRLGCINTHASILPRWRGAAPIQRAIQAGDKESGVTIMQMDVGLDTGDMLMVGKCDITPDTTAQMLHDSLSAIGADLVIQTLENMPIPVKQPTEGITYAEKIQKNESLIDWKMKAEEIKRHIMAFNPYPTAYTLFNGERIKIFNATVLSESTNQPAGTLIDDNLTVACGCGTVLQITQLQREGKKMLNASEFVMGNMLKKGDVFES